MTTGIYGAWGSVLSTNLAVINPRYTQSIAGWMGFSATACVSGNSGIVPLRLLAPPHLLWQGNVGGVIMGRFADRFHKLKSVIVVFLLAAAACFLAFTLCAAGSLDDHMSFETQFPVLVLLCSLGGFFLNSTIPLFFEVSSSALRGAVMSCESHIRTPQASAECTFPLPEGVTLVMLTNWNNVGALVFLALPYSEIPGPGMNLSEFAQPIPQLHA